MMPLVSCSIKFATDAMLQPIVLLLLTVTATATCQQQQQQEWCRPAIIPVFLRATENIMQATIITAYYYKLQMVRWQAGC